MVSFCAGNGSSYNTEGTTKFLLGVSETYHLNFYSSNVNFIKLSIDKSRVKRKIEDELFLKS